ncbi:hypothetical protein [Ramlibacter sp.]|uniref:hypothetical protein n=1 Tax=Ramlibacter sp. TaxID=1917967 RepID=UPI0017FC1011|nr:hypothetical protein [Ramlibacter sp.]MBA2674476.1 hypothetical protein [Ramlibacter sp.]
MPTLYPTRPTHHRLRIAAAALLLAACAPAALADTAGTRHLAPGFTSRPAGSKLLVMPADMELFSISAGGVTEPRADWTEAAQKNVKAALEARRAQLGAQVVELSEAQLDEFSEVAALHRAVADAIWVHHTRRGLELPTKAGKLDWSLGESARVLKQRTGADYALFTWVRDTYASNERKAAIVALALLGGFNTGGEQNGYASLVDLNTGRIVWFNDLRRMWGDLREPQVAAETVEALLKGFPAMKP